MIVWKAIIVKRLLTSHSHLATFQINVDSFYKQQVLYEFLLTKHGLFDDLRLPYVLEIQADGKYSNVLFSWLVVGGVVLVISNKKEYSHS